MPAALELCRRLVKDFRTEGEQSLRTYYAENAYVTENSMTGTVTGRMLGVPGNNRRITFRILHV